MQHTVTYIHHHNLPTPKPTFDRQKVNYEVKDENRQRVVKWLINRGDKFSGGNKYFVGSIN